MFKKKLKKCIDCAWCQLDLENPENSLCINPDVAEVSLVTGEPEGPFRLEKEIRNAISRGWQPLGGVTYCGNWFYQVIVKYEEVEEERCGSCRWFKYREPACTAGRCYALPDQVERNSYEPCCSLYAHKDQQ